MINTHSSKFYHTVIEMSILGEYSFSLSFLIYKNIKMPSLISSSIAEMLSSETPMIFATSASWLLFIMNIPFWIQPRKRLTFSGRFGIIRVSNGRVDCPTNRNLGDGFVVLLVVDTQKAIVNNRLYQFELFVSSVKKLIDTARKNHVEVIYVRHDDGSDSELTRGKDGYEIYADFTPADNEAIFDKYVNSAFINTGLSEYLKRKNEKSIVIIGLQTEYCIDATIKSGFEHGFEMIVPENTNSTFDNRFMDSEMTYKYYNEFIWNGRYAKCISFDEAIGLMMDEKS